MTTPSSKEETVRLASVQRYTNLDPLPEDALRDLVLAARTACGSAASAITFVERDRLRIVARSGFDISEATRDGSFCAATLGQTDVFEVRDASIDERFRDNILVRGGREIRHYAGVPLLAEDEFAIGALCVFDFVPRQLDDGARQVLTTLARQVVAQLDLELLKRRPVSVPSLDAGHLESLDRLGLAVQGSVLGLWEWNIPSRTVHVDQQWARANSFELAELRNDLESWIESHHPDDVPAIWEAMSAHLEGVTPVYVAEHRLKTAAGEWKWVCSRGRIVSRDEQGRPLRVVGGFTDIDQRKRTEHTLREQRRFLATLLSNLPGLAYRCRNEPAWPFEYVSEGVVELTGYSPQEFLTRKIDLGDIIHEEDRDLVWKTVQVAVEHHQPFEVNYRIHTAAGVLKWVWERGRAIPDGSGGGTVLEGFISDISDRKRAEDELAARNTFIETILDNLPIGVSVWHLPELELSYVNQRFIEVHGWPREVITDTEQFTPSLHPDPEYRRQMRDQIDRDLASGDPDRMCWEPRIMTASGVERRVRLTAFPIPGLSLRITTAEDVTDRWKAEQALRESHEIHRQLAENVREVSWIFDWDTKQLLYVSPAYEEVTGRSIQSLLDAPESYFELVYPEDRDALRDLTPPCDREHRIIRPDGSVRWIRTRAFPVRDDSGRLYRVAGISDDITERQLALLELEEARLAAEQASQLKNEFLANVSHELRTPMFGVMGMADLLLDTPLTEEQRDYIDTLRSSAESLLELISHLLDFARIEAGRIDLSPSGFELPKVLEEVVDLLAREAAAKQLDLGCFIDPALAVPVTGDPTRFRQVVVNLIANAIKFTDSGAVVIHARLDERNGEHGLLRVEVHDTGIGIGAKQRHRLFQPFSQLDASTTRQYSGTGLGLAISARIVEAMGGQIGVDSEAGLGSTFWFTARVGLRDTDGTSSLQSLAAKRVMVVMPEGPLRQATARQLADWGMQVLSPATVEEAIMRLGNGSRGPDAILLDSRLSLTERTRLVEAVRGHAGRDRIALLLLGPYGRGSADPDHVADYCLPRPVLPSRLALALKQVLNNHRARG
jgi:PAS domain S-box-containing protein